MRDYYKIASGHNNEAALATFLPQPRSDGIAWGRQTTAGDGLTYTDGFGTASLIWDAMTRAQLSTLLTTLGFTGDVRSVLVTIRLRRNRDRAFYNYNATIDIPVIPDQGSEGRGGWRNVRANVHHITALASGGTF